MIFQVLAHRRQVHLTFNLRFFRNNGRQTWRFWSAVFFVTHVLAPWCPMLFGIPYESRNPKCSLQNLPDLAILESMRLRLRMCMWTNQRASGSHKNGPLAAWRCVNNPYPSPLKSQMAVKPMLLCKIRFCFETSQTLSDWVKCQPHDESKDSFDGSGPGGMLFPQSNIQTLYMKMICKFLCI